MPPFAGLWNPSNVWFGRLAVRFQQWFMVACIGPLATINCEPGQARKGAAAAVDLGAGVWLVQAATILLQLTPSARDSSGIIDPDYRIQAEDS